MKEDSVKFILLVISKILWAGLIVVCLFSAKSFVEGMSQVQNVMQQMVVCGLSLVYVVIPYIIVRAFDELRKGEK